MSQFALRLPDSLHDYANRLAQEDSVSLNQFIVSALAEKVSALHTDEFFRERASRADRGSLMALLDRVPNVPPIVDDD